MEATVGYTCTIAYDSGWNISDDSKLNHVYTLKALILLYTR